MAEQTLEEVVALNPMADADVLYITVRNPPAIAVNTIRMLRRKHKNLTSASAVHKFAIMLGTYRLGRDGDTGQLVQRLSEKHAIAPTMPHRLSYAYRLPPSGRGFVRYAVYELTNNILSDLSEDLDISKGVLANLALLYGLDASSTWVPCKFKKGIVEEIDNFREYVRIQGQLL